MLWGKVVDFYLYFFQALLDELEAIDENNDEIPLIKGMLYYSACSAPTGVKMAASWFCSTSIKTLMDGATYEKALS